MQVFKVRNAHLAIPEILYHVEREGVERESRDGPVLKFPTPCTIWYQNPKERVVFWPERDANPFFHLMESLWMLAGRKDVKFVEKFVKRMGNYSDDGEDFHAAYGYRWRKHFGFDQVRYVIQGLEKNKDCRRQVISMWHPNSDLGQEGKDFPCNIIITFQVNDKGELDMVVSNRSNDIMMGALGANCVHMSVLQEYVAAGIGIPVGGYWQVSSNLHIYKRDYNKYRDLSIHVSDGYRTQTRCLYAQNVVEPTSIVNTPIREWDHDLAMWMDDPIKVGIRDKFFTRTATPMYIAHMCFKQGDTSSAMDIIRTQMPDGSDWKLACTEWLERRRK